MVCRRIDEPVLDPALHRQAMHLFINKYKGCTRRTDHGLFHPLYITDPVSIVMGCCAGSVWYRSCMYVCVVAVARKRIHIIAAIASD